MIVSQGEQKLHVQAKQKEELGSRALVYWLLGKTNTINTNVLLFSFFP